MLRYNPSRQMALLYADYISDSIQNHIIILAKIAVKKPACKVLTLQVYFWFKLSKIYCITILIKQIVKLLFLRNAFVY